MGSVCGIIYSHSRDNPLKERSLRAKTPLFVLDFVVEKIVLGTARSPEEETYPIMGIFFQEPRIIPKVIELLRFMDHLGQKPRVYIDKRADHLAVYAVFKITAPWGRLRWHLPSNHRQSLGHQVDQDASLLFVAEAQIGLSNLESFLELFFELGLLKLQIVQGQLDDFLPVWTHTVDTIIEGGPTVEDFLKEAD